MKKKSLGHALATPAQQFERLKKKGRRKIKGRTKKFLVFISHYANDDGEIAAQLKAWIETQYQTKVKVFVSSSEHNGVTGNSIKSGTFAASEIGKNLSDHDVLISLLTPTSIKRPWVMFESGAGFGRGRRFIPILCKGLKRESIDNSNPLKELEIRSANDSKEFTTILRELDGALKYKHTDVGVEELRTALCKSDSRLAKTNTVSAPMGKPAIGRPLGVGVLISKEELGGFCPGQEKDMLHTVYVGPHDKLSKHISDDCDNSISCD